MNRFIKIFITSTLFISLFINNISAVSSWGVDEIGKFSFKNITVVVKDEYSQESEIVIEYIQFNYCVENVKIISESTNTSERTPLILLVTLPLSDENQFYITTDKFANDQYIEKVLKDYYMTTDKSYLGDANQDSKITTDDARTILKYAAGQIEIKTKTEKILADVNQDGIITTQDARHTLAICCGIKTD